MRRGMFLMVLLALFLIPALNPSPYSIPAARGDEPLEALFSVAEDGAESSQSLTVFAETSADDTLHYPDTGPWSTTDDNADSYVVYGEVSTTTGTIADTYDDDANHHQTTKTYSGAFGMDYTIDAGGIRNVESPILSVDAGFSCDLGFPGVVVRYYIYNYDTSAFVQFWSYTGDGVFSGVLCDREDAITHEYISNSTDQITIRFYHASASASTSIIDVYYIALLYTDNYEGYAESFADISDWSTSDTSISTDGDVATITENGAGSTGRAYASFSSTDFFEYYYEFRIESMTATTANLEFWDGAAYNTLETFTAAGTYKGIISDTDAATMQRIGFLVGSEGGNIKPDYLRIGPSDEMGWQHDGSTTAALTDNGGAEKTYTASSDGDILTLNITTGAGASGSSYYYINFDTTATKIDLERDYYPYVEMRARLIGNTGAGAGLLFGADGYISYLDSNFITTSWTTYRINHKASTSVSSVKACYLYWGAGASSTIEFEVDYVKAYSIANWTIDNLDDETVNDFAYVDSGELVLSEVTSGDYVRFIYDPVLSVDTSTYNVWNVSCYNLAAGFRFRHYVDAWIFEDVGETRGDFPSGILILMQLYLYSEITIGSIRFIEDGTAPDADIVVSPNPPDDAEQVTLSSIIFDDVEVWKVWYNAISYPTGFSDVDYEATEGQENYWSYSFSSLIAGDYCFKVIANDGANNNTITQSNRDYATVRFTVREAVIELITYTLFGAGSDFTYMQYSFYISHDCTFIIEEWSDSWAKNETHSGSVVEGDRNIAWDKIGVNDVDANYTITFTNGSLTKVIDGGYITAYKALQVTEIDFVNLEQSDSWTTNLTINFYTNKEVDWTVYDRDDDDALLHSGTTTEGDGFITWVQNTARGAHQFAVKWTDGISDQWYNNSYWVFDRNIDDLPGGADPGADQRRTIEFWATIGGIAGILGIMVIGLSHYNMDEKIKNLPNYRTQERGRR